MPPRFVTPPVASGAAYISVCMEYGKRIHMKGINPADPEADNSFRARVFFLFLTTGYNHRERVEPIVQGDRWKLFSKDVAEQETFEGGGRSPFPTDDPPLVPVTEWHAVDKPANSDKAEQDGADQPATVPESKSEGGTNPRDGYACEAQENLWKLRLLDRDAFSLRLDRRIHEFPLPKRKRTLRGLVY